MDFARAIVLAAPSNDDRPWSSAGANPKSLLPVGNRPILFHALDTLRDAGVTEALLLAVPSAADPLRHAVGDGSRWGIRMSYGRVSTSLGVPEALEAAGGFLGEEPVIVHQADGLLRSCLSDHMPGFARDRLDALALVLVPDGIAGPLPPPPATHLLSTQGVAMMRDGLREADELSFLRRRGGQVRLVNVDGCLACRGDETTLMEANRQVLGGLRTEVTDALLQDCVIQGSVVVHPTASVRNTLLRGPVIVGAGAEIADSYVGPYTSVGASSLIRGSEIEHSIVMEGAKVMFVSHRIETSVIGRGASIVRRFEMPNAVRVSLGDGAEVALC